VIKAIWFVLAGMGIVFATLTVLMLVMIALNRWLGPTPEDNARTSRPGHA
jgi:Na+-transporting methylmalonyl-CoA/oxaloacetate decarboxylase gamma subunit